MNKKILLVEDEHVTALMNRKTLEKHGFSVVTASSGESAVETVETTPDIDLILMDIDLGDGIDGTQAADSILSQHDLPLVFLSSHTEPEVVNKTKGITNYGYVVKNTGDVVLIAAIEMAFKLFDAKQIVQKNEEALRESEAAVRKKLKAITEPEEDIGSLELADIIDIEELRVLMEDTFNVSKVGGAILDVSGKILVSTTMEDICGEFHRVHPDTAKNCFESDLALGSGVPAGTFKAYRCKNNMWDMVTPLYIGGKHVGNIYVGQFFYEDEDVDYEEFRRQARLHGFDESAYIAALDRVPRLKRETVDRAMAFYLKLAEMISSLSYTTIKLSRNIVQHEQAEEKLKETTELLQNITDNMHDFIAVTDLQGNFKFAGKSLELLGYDLEYLIGRNVMEFVHPDDIGYLTDVNTKCLEEKQDSEKAQYRYRRADGTYIWLETIGRFIKDDEGNIKEIVFSSRDITELKQKQAELNDSSKKFTKVFLENPVGMLIARVSDATIIDVNKSLEKISGFTRDEFIGNNTINLQLWADTADRDRVIQILAESGTVRDYDCQFRLKDGTTRWGNYAADIININGEQCFLIILQDITDRKMLEKQLIHTETLFNLITDNISDFIMIAGLDYKLQYASKSVAEKSGYTLAEVLQIPLDKLYTEESYKKLIDTASRELTPDRLNDPYCDISIELDLECVNKDGSTIWNSLKYRLIRDEHGRPDCILSIGRDITERKQAEEQLKKLYNEKSLYLSKMSHEIRTPLSSIIGMTDLALMTDDDSVRLDFLETVKSSSQHLLGVINNVIDYSKIESQGVVLRHIAFNLSSEIEQAVSIVYPQSLDKHLYLETDIKIPHDVIVLGDPVRFRQVLINIIGNSVKFTEKGGVVISAEQVSEKSSGLPYSADFQISITDTGPGIPDEKKDAVFDVFNQADPGNNGSGLGLPIAREIIQMMGGTITLESEPGHGSSFIIDVPFPVSDAQSEDTPVSDVPVSHADVAYTILIAEDNPIIRKLLTTVIRKYGHTAITAGNGRQAIDLLKEQHFDLILMDVEMPEMDGIEAVQRIRSGESGADKANIPIIGLSAHESGDIEHKCLDAGMNWYVTKPIDIVKINPLILELIQKKNS